MRESTRECPRGTGRHPRRYRGTLGSGQAAHHHKQEFVTYVRVKGAVCLGGKVPSTSEMLQNWTRPNPTRTPLQQGPPTPSELEKHSPRYAYK